MSATRQGAARPADGDIRCAAVRIQAPLRANNANDVLYQWVRAITNQLALNAKLADGSTAHRPDESRRKGGAFAGRQFGPASISGCTTETGRS